MAYNPETYDAAIMAALNVAGVNSAAPHGKHWGVAPDGIDLTHIVVMVASDSDDRDIGSTGTISIAYLVRACAATREAANAALAAADAALNGATLAVPGFIELRRQGGGQRYTDGDGFFNAANYYRLLFSY